jgi:hypothetical protein
MLNIDKDRFFTDFTARTGLPLGATRRSGLDFLLGALAADAEFSMLREMAYVLATIRWETAHTFQPVQEKRFSKSGNPRGWAHQDVYWRTGFYGRGYVQLTWEDNYRKASFKLTGQKAAIDGTAVTIAAKTLLEHPDYAMQPEVAYAIASRGMRDGWFTGKKLSNYISEGNPPDYIGARRIINGTDRAPEIATMAGQFELLLRASI